jgi:hypothetical protein
VIKNIFFVDLNHQTLVTKKAFIETVKQSALTSVHTNQGT